MESAAGGDVCTAAPELGGFSVPAGSTEGADGGAGQVGRPGAGAVTELQAAGRSPTRGWRAEETPTQQKKPGGRTGPRRQGYDDADDIFHGSCKTPQCFNMGSLYESDCLLYFCKNELL